MRKQYSRDELIALLKSIRIGSNVLYHKTGKGIIRGKVTGIDKRCSNYNVSDPKDLCNHCPGYLEINGMSHACNMTYTNEYFIHGIIFDDFISEDEFKI